MQTPAVVEKKMVVEQLCMGCMEPKGQATICPNCGWSEKDQASHFHLLPPGTILEKRYLVGRMLEEGHCYVNYLCYDLQTHTKGVLKEFSPQSFFSKFENTTPPTNHDNLSLDFNMGVGKFIEEGMALSKFPAHSGYQRVVNLFKARDTAYQILEYVEGESLQSFVAKNGGQISLSLLVKILLPALEALQILHENGLLHYDLHPGNIIVSPEMQGTLINFNYTSFTLFQNEAHLPRILRSGYAPPEFYLPEGMIGSWSDIYSLGAIIYSSVTGKVPPDGQTRLTSDTLTRPSRLGKTMPLEVENAIMRALSVYPTTRFHDVQSLKEILYEHVIQKELEKASRALDAFTTIVCPACQALNEVLMTDVNVGTAYCNACGKNLIVGADRSSQAIDAFTTVVCPACSQNNEVVVTDLQSGTAQCLNCHSALTFEVQQAETEMRMGEGKTEEELLEPPVQEFDFSPSPEVPEASTESEVEEAPLQEVEEISEEELPPPAESEEASDSSPSVETLAPESALNTIACPICNAENVVSATEILSEIRCIECGHPLRKGAETLLLQPQEEIVIVPPKSARRWMIPLAIILLLGIGGFSVYYYFFSSTPANSTHLTAFIKKGDVLYQAGQYEEALREYQKALNIDKTNPHVQQQIQIINSIIEENQRRYQKRLMHEQFSQLVREGDSLMERKLFQEARLAYEEAAKIFPDSSLITERLNRLSEKQAFTQTPPPQPPERKPDVLPPQPKTEEVSETNLILNPAEDLANKIKSAAPHSILYLPNGIFPVKETLIIDKAIELRGNGIGVTIIRADSVNPLFRIVASGALKASSIAFELTLPEGGDVLQVAGGKIELQGCRITGAHQNVGATSRGAGLRLSGDSDARLYQTELTRNYYGVVLEESSQSDISGCEVRENEIGLLISGEARPEIENNTIQENYLHGVKILQKAQPRMIENIIRLNGGSGIVFEGESYNGTFRKNQIIRNKEVGILLTQFSQPILEENQIEENQTGGVVFRDNSRGILRNNIIQKNKAPGIRISGNANPTISENEISSNLGDGIELLEKARAVIERNKISLNSGDGVSVILKQAGGFIRGNTFTANKGYGISILSESKPTLFNNVFKDNYEGHIFEEAQ
ncbi:MAG: tetratricopeptide repeat protein [Calditrichaeota bacterium]|nr:MAG: tetratricopeptide repeat protein [Calditrichota bacterium]